MQKSNEPTVIQVKSHRNLSPNLPTDKENCSSPTQFSKRENHKVVVYSESEEENEE